MPTRPSEISVDIRLGCTTTTPCSMHRRPDRVYEDQVWAWQQANPGHRVFHPEVCCP